MKIIMDKTKVRRLLGLFGLVLVGCSTADNDMVGGNIQAVNHTLNNINWLSVNGYRADGGGGRSCCIVMPIKWRPGLKAHVEWEVDVDQYAYSKWPSDPEGYQAAQLQHKAKYQHYSTIVDIPEWPETNRCGLSVHFLVCNQVKVTSSCSSYYSPNYPIKEPLDMKEPVVCPK
ncbi:DUF3304 domain-containing protein [Pseudomonas sp. V98_8]|uniref:DUF3304 domain-containing protein n=1 Tax=Pseudomonas sp. V98_8 TaxID=3044228 RepID=UPI00249EA087|nr:DUF3304 domain-containing protein [Pseudomonas sp. V98_8]MDI3394863.1 DUF3304 domain-containing protein [Pseudomonas sp. V98_8]